MRSITVTDKNVELRDHLRDHQYPGEGMCNVPLLLQSFRHIPSRSAVLRHHIIIATQCYMRARLLSPRNHSDILLPAFGPFYPFYHMFSLCFYVRLSTILIISTVSHGTL